MQASELAEQVVSAANIATCDGYYEIDTDKVTAIIEQAKAHWIDEGMEWAAVIIRQRVEVASKLLHNSQDWDCEEYPGSDQTLMDWIFDATAIRAAKGTGNEG